MLGYDGPDIQFLDKADHWCRGIHLGHNDGFCADRLEVAVEDMPRIGALCLQNQLLSMQFREPDPLASREGMVEPDSQHHFIDIERFEDKPRPQSRPIGNADVYGFPIQLLLDLIDRQFKNRNTDPGVTPKKSRNA